MLINACKPFAWRDQFPKTNVFSAAERNAVESKWSELLAKIALQRSAANNNPAI
jgi:hypothetical protein